MSSQRNSNVLSIDVQIVKNTISAYTCEMNRDIMDSSRAAVFAMRIKKTKRDYVNRVHTRVIKSIDKVRADGSITTLWMTKPSGSKNYLYAGTEEELIEKLYDHYIQEDDLFFSLGNFFYSALSWKAQDNVSESTIKEYNRIWKKYFEDNPIVQQNIKNLSRSDWEIFFRNTIRTNSLTKKVFSGIRNVMSFVMKYCLEENILDHNVIRDIDYDNLPYAREKAYVVIKANPFTETQTEKIIEWCIAQVQKPKVRKVYYYAIIFVLRMGLRFAELYALKWCKVNLEERVLCVDDQGTIAYDVKFDDDDEEISIVSNGRTLVGHLKAEEQSRYLPIPDDIYEILLLLKKLNPDSEYVFRSEKDDSFRYHTLNEKVKAAAAAIGLPANNYRTHSLRTTAATLLYLKCLDIYQVQRFLGHTSPEMTAKYIKNILGNQALEKTMKKDSKKWLSLVTTQ